MLGNTNSAVPSAKEVLENIKTYASSVKTDLHNVCEEKKEEIGALVTTAQTTATNSANSALEAGRSAAAAAESATAAQAAATNSANSATAAGASATAAANSATAAQEAATNSSNSASAAGTSATSAASSATSAQEAATNSANSASAAGTSATSAASSATSAQEAATSSANSASAAEDSATAAANSATAAQATASNMANITYTKDEIDDLIEQTDLLPEQTGNSGKFLTTDGTNTSWSNVGSGLEIGDIGIAPLGIDETKGLRRYLNGTILSNNANTKAFIDKLEEASKLNSSLICTDSEWQEIANASDTGSCGKFARIVDGLVGNLNISGNEASGFSADNYFAVDAPVDDVIEYQIGFKLDNRLTTDECYLFSSKTGAFRFRIKKDAYDGGQLIVNTSSSERYVNAHPTLGFNHKLRIVRTGKTVDIYLNNFSEPEETITYTANSFEDDCSTMYICGKKGSTFYPCVINLNDCHVKNLTTNEILWEPSKITYRLPKINCFIEGLNNLTSLGNLASLKMSTTLGSKYIDLIKYPYFIQVATGSEDEVNITNEIQLNNPFFFGMSLYSDSDPNNISWLISNGTYHSGTVYSGFYQWLLKNYNGTEVTEGVSVKANTASDITDYDYVINTTETTFRLPVSVNNTEVNYYSARVSPDDNITDPGTSDPGGDIGIGEVTGAKLYFYVGETIQNANLIDAGRISEELPNKLSIDANNLTISGKALIADLVFPSTNSINLTRGASGTTYTAPASGWFVYAGSLTTTGRIHMAACLQDSRYSVAGNWAGASLPVQKGETMTFYYEGSFNDGGLFKFVYAEGEK